MKNATIVDLAVAMPASAVSLAPSGWLAGTALPTARKAIGTATRRGSAPATSGFGPFSVAARVRPEKFSEIGTGVARAVEFGTPGADVALIADAAPVGTRFTVQDRHGSYQTFPYQGSDSTWDRLS